MSTCKHCWDYHEGYCGWLSEQAREGVIAVGVELPQESLDQIRVPVPADFACSEIRDCSPEAQAEALHDAEVKEHRRAVTAPLAIASTPPPASLPTHK